MPQQQFRSVVSALATALVLMACGAVAHAQSSRSQDVQRIQNATAIFRSAFEGAGAQIPKDILRNGQCVMIIPGYKTLALGLGGTYGKGIAMCRNTSTPPGAQPKQPAAATTGMKGWSAPIFVAIGGASLGPQIGVESADLLIVFKDRHGMESMLNNKVRLGVSAAAAAGPIGRRVEAATDAAMRSQVIAYARSRGIFAGVNVNGAIVQPDESGNRAMYPHQYWQDVLEGKIKPAAESTHLIAELNGSPYTNPALRTPASAAGVPAGRMGVSPTMTIGPGTQVPMLYQIGFGYEHITGSMGLNGWDLRAGWRPLLHEAAGLSLIADVGRASGSQALLATSVKSTEWTFLFGPEFGMPHRVFDPYANALFGYAHLSQDTLSPNASSSAGFSTFAWQLGAGLKLNITRWASIRLIEVDLLHTSFASSGASHARIILGGTLNF